MRKLTKQLHERARRSTFCVLSDRRGTAQRFSAQGNPKLSALNPTRRLNPKQLSSICGAIDSFAPGQEFVSDALNPEPRRS